MGCSRLQGTNHCPPAIVKVSISKKMLFLLGQLEQYRRSKSQKSPWIWRESLSNEGSHSSDGSTLEFLGKKIRQKFVRFSRSHHFFPFLNKVLWLNKQPHLCSTWVKEQTFDTQIFFPTRSCSWMNQATRLWLPATHSMRSALNDQNSSSPRRYCHQK